MLAKKKYFLAYFERNKNKSSEIWKGIRSLVNLKTSQSSNIKLMDGNNNLISDPQKIGNIFNDHFASLGAKIEQKIPVTQGNFKYYLNKKDNGNLIINCPNSLFLTPAVPGEIEKLIDDLDMKKATGPNSIPVFILKLLKPFLGYIFNTNVYFNTQKIL